MGSLMQNIKVIAISPGIAIGRVLRIQRLNRLAEPNASTIPEEKVESEISRLHAALETTRKQLQELRSTLGAKLSAEESGIFDAHLLLLDDRMLLTDIEKHIREEKNSAEFAISRSTEHFIGVFSAIPDPYLQERAADLRDVTGRVMANLTEEEVARPSLDDRRIIVADALTPSETVQLDCTKVLGFAVETGSATSHAAILARSMRLPAVSGLPHEVFDKLRSNDIVIIDGVAGRLIVNPDARTEEAYRLKAAAAGKLIDELGRETELTPETTDGFKVELAANIDAAGQYAEASKMGAYGIGLFRTEFMFMEQNGLPDEEAQYKCYRELLISAGERPVTIRTLDIGADKVSGNVYRFTEVNPALGLRGIRLCLYERRDLFTTQLRALFRAGVSGDLRVMVPMVSSVQELIECRELIRQVQNQLAQENLEFSSRVLFGAMIETPAAALSAGDLAEYVDFFSIGTNDLVQYTMAIDRLNERVSYLNRAASPAVLRLIRHCVECAERKGIPVAVCGQMAADPAAALLLVGMGIQELSMASPAIPLVRRAIRSVSMFDAEQLVERALRATDDDEPMKLAEELLQKHAPELIDL
ncbi:MAG: phosphoenolpyruvate--protein phosphotransferase [Victivallaceae bacterium]|nr:phosphoenolpyruvate--protein phosphotransferase [Victivallaceae bacterium]